MSPHENWRRLMQQVADGGYDRLSPDERRWFCVQTLLDTIEADGLVAYFSGEGADRLGDCKEALRLVGSGAMPGLLSLVAKFFPFGVPQDAAARAAVIAGWPKDGSMEQILDPVEEQAQVEARFVRKKLARFIEERHLVGR